MKHAVILAAGFGSRLARDGNEIPKPLRMVRGEPLLYRNLKMLHRVGIRHVVIVVGYRADWIQSAVAAEPFFQTQMQIEWAYNPHYDKANGISVLAAEPYVGDEDFLLLMADHVFEISIFRTMVRTSIPDLGAVLGIDRKIHSIFDLDDATKVLRDAEGRILKISKTLKQYNAIDIGMFACSSGLMDALKEARDLHEGDCSLSQGVGTLSQKGIMWTQDIGEAFWQDVDTPMTLDYAEQVLAKPQWNAEMVMPAA